MAALKITLLPTLIVEEGNMLLVKGEVRFDNGDYAAGGIKAQWDYTTTPSTHFAVFRQTGLIHASLPALAMDFRSGDSAYALYGRVSVVTPLATPRVMVTTVATGVEVGAGALAAGMQSPTAPHEFALRFAKNI
jgi:hypothetical protein